MLKKLYFLPILACLLLPGCVYTGFKVGQDTVYWEGIYVVRAEGRFDQANIIGPLVEASVPVFDPGLESADGDKVWDELRRVEAVLFAVKLKRALIKTKAWKTVRVIPDMTAPSHVYFTNKILNSNGKNLKVQVRVAENSNEEWAAEELSINIEETYYPPNDKNNIEPYQIVFDGIASGNLRVHEMKPGLTMTHMRAMADMQFGLSLTEEIFSPYVKIEGNDYSFVKLPKMNDPDFLRMRRFRELDRAFLDDIQPHYDALYDRLIDAYKDWHIEMVNNSKPEKKQMEHDPINPIVVGGVGASEKMNLSADIQNQIAAFYSGKSRVSRPDSSAGYRMPQAQRDLINKFGKVLHHPMPPKTMRVENQSITLIGNIQEQYQQWRAFLKKVFLLNRGRG